MKELSKKDLLKKYDSVSYFSEGLAVAKKDNKQFHIYPNGMPAYKERYNSVGFFSKGLAWVTKDGKKFYIRPDGTRAK